MAKELTPILVKIGLKTEDKESFNKYPDFNKLQCVIDSGIDWAIYLDIYGAGWQYDRSCGHDTERKNNDKFDSPVGKWMGMVLVPEDFADQAVLMFPDVVEYLTETEAEDFYDTKSAVHLPDNEIDSDIVNAIQVRQTAGLTLTQDELDAIDPEKPNRGIVKNKHKKFADFKVLKDIKLKAKVV